MQEITIDATLQALIPPMGEEERQKKPGAIKLFGSTKQPMQTSIASALMPSRIAGQAENYLA